VLDVAVDELVEVVAGTAAGVEGVVVATAGAAVSFFSSVPVPLVSLSELDGGFIFSE